MSAPRNNIPATANVGGSRGPQRFPNRNLNSVTKAPPRPIGNLK